MSKMLPGQVPFDPSRKGGFSPMVRDQPDSFLDSISESSRGPTAEQRRAERIKTIKTRAVELYAGNEENAAIFLHSPNPNLADHTPIEFMEQGDFRPVERLIHAMEHREMS